MYFKSYLYRVRQCFANKRTSWKPYSVSWSNPFLVVVGKFLVRLNRFLNLLYKFHWTIIVQDYTRELILLVFQLSVTKTIRTTHDCFRLSSSVNLRNRNHNFNEWGNARQMLLCALTHHIHNKYIYCDLSIGLIRYILSGKQNKADITYGLRWAF